MDNNMLAALVVAMMLAAFCFVAWLALRGNASRRTPVTLSWVVTDENRGGLPIAAGRWMVEITGPNQMKLGWLDPHQLDGGVVAPVTDERS
jgi:hypothetical protein